MKISVVLPVYNESRFMHIALDSLQEQTMPYDELIIVDNGSTDNSVEIAKQYTDKVYSSIRGKLNALHTGVLMALGNIIFTVDADCWYEPTYIDRMAKHFEDPNIVLVLGTCYHDGYSSFVNFTFGVSMSLIYPFFKYSYGATRAFRRDVFFEVGGFNLNVNQLRLTLTSLEEEVSFHQRFAQRGKVIRDISIIAHHTGRRSYCAVCNRESEGDVCEYCSQIQRGERF